jgi:hypothetical protein
MARDSQIDPALKAWIDRVLAPALVRQYLDACREVGDNGEDRLPSLDFGTSNEDEPVQ